MKRGELKTCREQTPQGFRWLIQLPEQDAPQDAPGSPQTHEAPERGERVVYGPDPRGTLIETLQRELELRNREIARMHDVVGYQARAIVTQEFPVYEVDRAQIDPYYLKRVLRSRYFQRAIRAITTGHSNRRHTQSTDFENLTVFVPEDTNVQMRVSEAVKQRQRGVASMRAEYLRLLEAVDQLIIGEVQPEEILGLEVAT